MNNPFSIESKEILNILHTSGEAYYVGGCVRDILLNKPPHDEDICTNLKPNEVIELFESKGYKVLPTGIDYGTVTVMSNEEAFEITTYRKDFGYSNGRHPDSIEFADSILEDSKRRDFTFNAMYFDGEKIEDPQGGQYDIENKIIHCVGDANDRFNEDSLRMLRAIRFSSTLGFELGDYELKAIVKNAEKINLISKERIKSEFDKILQGDSPAYAFSLMKYTSLLDEIIPNLNRSEHFHESLNILNNYKGDNLNIKYALLFNSLDYNDVDKICKDLKMRSKDVESITKLVRFSNNIYFNNKENIANFIVSHPKVSDQDYKYIEDILNVKNTTKKLPLLNFSTLNNILQQPHRIKDLSINGNDLKDIGFKNEMIGEELNKILQFSIINNITNKDELLSIARKDKIMELKCNELLKSVGYTDMAQNSPHHFGSVYEHTDAVIKDFMSRNNDLVHYLAAAFHDVGKFDTIKVNPKTGYNQFLDHEKRSVEIFEQNAKEFEDKLTKEEIEYVSELIKLHDKQYSKQGKIKTMLENHPDGFAADLISLRLADISGQSDFQRVEKLEEVLNFANKIIKIGTPEQLKGMDEIINVAQEKIRDAKETELALAKTKETTYRFKEHTAANDRNIKIDNIDMIPEALDFQGPITYEYQKDNLKMWFSYGEVDKCEIDGKDIREKYPEIGEDFNFSVSPEATKEVLDLLNEIEGRTLDSYTEEIANEPLKFLARTYDNYDIQVNEDTFNYLEENGYLAKVIEEIGASDYEDCINANREFDITKVVETISEREVNEIEYEDFMEK